jgi:hypothetical protein
MLAAVEQDHQTREAIFQVAKHQVVSKLEEGLAGPMTFVDTLYDLQKFYNSAPLASNRLPVLRLPLQRDLLRSGQDILDQQRHSRMVAQPDFDAVRTLFDRLASTMVEEVDAHTRAFAVKPTKSVRFDAST